MSEFLFSIEPVKVEKINTLYRRINSPIPAPGTKEILESLKQTESKSMHGQLPIVWDKAKNFSVYDIAGNKWIDFTSTIFVANIGHSNKKLISNLKDVIDRPILSCYAYSNSYRRRYLEELKKFSNNRFDKAFLLSAGTEATEAVFKLMRMYGQTKQKRRLGVIALEGNWHGRTLGAQMLSGNMKQKEWINNLDKDIHHLSFPYPWDVSEENANDFFKSSISKLVNDGIDFKKDICGVFLETFQGWGALFYPVNYVKAVENFCNENDILFGFDEMQSGFSRTGKNFGFEHYDANPDLIACGKGMGGGLPLSGVLGKKEIMDLPEIGNMSSTHSANPLVCVAGLSVLEEINSQQLTVEANRKGIILHNKLNAIKEKFSRNISWVLGKGMIAGVLFKKESGEPDLLSPSIIAEKCMQKGLLLVHTGRESIKIGPPLTISDDALIEGIEVFEEAIGEVLG